MQCTLCTSHTIRDSRRVCVCVLHWELVAGNMEDDFFMNLDLYEETDKNMVIP